MTKPIKRPKFKDNSLKFVVKRKKRKKNVERKRRNYIETQDDLFISSEILSPLQLSMNITQFTL